jgi:hypothetical protein
MMSVDFMVMGSVCRRSCRKSPNHAFHAGSNWMIRQSPTVRQLGTMNIAAAHCRRALRRSQSTTMRKRSYKDEGSWKLLAVATSLEPLEPRGRGW